MTAPRPEAAILAERLTVVLAIGAANGAHQRAQAGAGGARIEVMGLENRSGGAPEDELAAARSRAAEAEARLAEAVGRIAALEDRLAALDREMAAAAT